METNRPEIHGIWWPHPDSFNDLIVEENEGGFALSAPDGTPCGEWLWYYSQSEELTEKFNDAFVKVLADHLNYLKEKNGSKE